MFQSILNILLSPAMLPIMIGLIAGGSRLMRWANENKAKRQQHINYDRAREEYLRTGKASDNPGPRPDAGAQASTPAQTNVSSGQTRLEELRQQRIEQLRKIREQRSVAANPQQTRAPSPRTAQPRAATPQGRSSAPPRAGGRVPTSVPSAQGQLRPAVQPRNVVPQRESLAQRRAKAQRQQQAPSATKPISPSSPTSGRSRLSDLQINPELNQHVGTLPVEHADDPIGTGFGVEGATHHSTGVHKLLKKRSSVRQAFVLSEVLSTPVAMRDTKL